jgi:hypothetical protein
MYLMDVKLVGGTYKFIVDKYRFGIFTDFIGVTNDDFAITHIRVMLDSKRGRLPRIHEFLNNTGSIFKRSYSHQ